MLLAIIGLFIGIGIGLLSPFEFPAAYSGYVAIGILACVDSVLGGLRAHLEDDFRLSIFMSGFFGNGLLSMFLVFLGNRLNIQLSIAAIVVYGTRLFDNFTALRRFLLNKREKRDKIDR